jgi:hypothetical protein
MVGLGECEMGNWEWGATWFLTMEGMEVQEPLFPEFLISTFFFFFSGFAAGRMVATLGAPSPAPSP